MASLIAPASRSRMRVAQIVETNRGETPDTGNILTLPHLDNTALNQTQTFERSNEVKSNRQGGKQVGGNIENGGTLAMPLKEDNGVRALVESAISDALAAQAQQTGADFAYGDGTGTGGNDEITSTTTDFVALNYQIGDVISTAMSTTAGNDILATANVRLLAVAANSIEFAAGTLVSSEAFAASTTLDNFSVYAASSTTRKFFTHEISYLDLSPALFEYFRGNEVNTWTITIPTSGEVTSEFAMVGLIGKISQTEFDRSNNLSGTLTAGTLTRVDAADTVPFAGSVTGSELDRGSTIAPEVESLTININNNRAARFAVGQQTAAFVEEGDFDAELTFGLYFRDEVTYEQYLAGTRTSLRVTVKDQQDGHQFTCEFPNIVFTAGDKALSGQAIIENMTAFAEEDPVTGSKMRVWFQPSQ